MATSNIKFGTSGWRAVIAEDFTVSSLRRVAHAAAEHVKENREYGYKGEEFLLSLRKAGKPAPKTAKGRLCGGEICFGKPWRFPR